MKEKERKVERKKGIDELVGGGVGSMGIWGLVVRYISCCEKTS